MGLYEHQCTDWRLAKRVRLGDYPAEQQPADDSVFGYGDVFHRHATGDGLSILWGRQWDMASGKIGAMRRPTLTVFAGMPGSGKTTLARKASRHLGLPIFSKDRIQRVLRDHHLADEHSGDGYYIILDMADEQLSLGVSVILDATFPLDHFRLVASEIAARHKANFCAIYCYCSDDAVWEARMERRVQYVPGWKPVGWEVVLRMRQYYQPWNANAQMMDSLYSPQENFTRVLATIQSARRHQYIPNQPLDPLFADDDPSEHET